MHEERLSPMVSRPRQEDYCCVDAFASTASNNPPSHSTWSFWGEISLGPNTQSRILVLRWSSLRRYRHSETQLGNVVMRTDTQQLVWLFRTLYCCAHWCRTERIHRTQIATVIMAIIIRKRRYSEYVAPIHSFNFPLYSSYLQHGNADGSFCRWLSAFPYDSNVLNSIFDSNKYFMKSLLWTLIVEWYCNEGS